MNILLLRTWRTSSLLTRQFHLCSAQFSHNKSSSSSDDIFDHYIQRVKGYTKELRRHARASLKHRQLQSQINNLNEAMAIAKTKKGFSDVFEHPPTRISLEVLSSGTCNIEPCLLIRTHSRGYLINCPESTSRILPNFSLRASNINDILITNCDIRRIGGISGFMLAQDKEVEPTRIHGPNIIKSYLEFLRPFADSNFGEAKYPGVMIEQPWDSGPYKDLGLTINYIPMQHLESGANAFSPIKDRDEREMISIAYLIETNPGLPKIDMMKVMQQKVPKGPLIGKLKAGETVVLDDGRTIRPEDVYADDDGEPGEKRDSSFLVLDAYSLPQFKKFLASSTMQPYLDGKKHLDYIVHMTRPAIFDTEIYQNFSLKFDRSKTTQIIVNGTGKPDPHLESVYKVQAVHTMLDNELFPELWPKFSSVINEESRKHVDSHGRIIARPFQRYVLRGPDRRWIDDCQIDLRPEINPSITKIENDKLIESYQLACQNIPSSSPEPFPKIHFLGTASAVPSKYRNVTSIMLQTADSFYLLDCGEGTYGQIVHQYGEKTSEVLTKLKVIFVTHTHQDHTNGLVTLLQERKRAVDEAKNKNEIQKLVVVCNRNVMKHMHTFTKRFYNIADWAEFITPMMYVDRRPACVNVSQMFEIAGLSASLPDIDVTAVKVNHTSDASGYVITTKDTKRKIVFSGDTTPCDLLAEAGKNADILIHEATFEDGRENDAQFKKHSTMGQAVNIGKLMNAKYIILTHFSARYSKIPVLPEYLEENNVGIAFDNLVVSMDSIPRLIKLTDIHRKLYEKELFDLGVKSLQYGLRPENKTIDSSPPSKKRAIDTAAASRN